MLQVDDRGAIGGGEGVGDDGDDADDDDVPIPTCS